MRRTLKRAGVGAAAVILLVVAVASPILGVAQGSNPFRGKRLYVDPNNPASKQAATWARSRPADAERMRRLGAQSQAIWLGDWIRDVRNETDALVTRIARAGALPVFVAYNIPHRDCGQHSRGGSRSADDYRRWIVNLARGADGRQAVVILEPDALPALDCLPLRLKDERYVLLRDAVRTLKAARMSVYIDAGHSNWKQPAEMADRLKKAGIDLADGFALNVSNYHSTAASVAYGDRLSRLVGGKHYIVDTSRNGAGVARVQEWCNARNQALGTPPTTDTKIPLADAFLWVKTPGQSDGTCNGGPAAGKWWADYALELTKAAEAIAAR